MKPRSVPAGTTSIRYTKAMEIAEKHAERARGFSTPEKLAEYLDISLELARELARELFSSIRHSVRAACFDAIRDVIEVDMTPLAAHPETAR